MPDFTVLHLTDVHFGQRSMDGRWPTIKAQMFDDLTHMVSQIGPVNLIAFTGDIANRGAESEFRMASEFLEELGLHLLSEAGELPLLAAVPGNHDLVRPSRRTAQQRVLEELWDERTEAAFFDDDEDEVRALVDSMFTNYRAWLDSQPLPQVAPDHTGPLVGDFSFGVRSGDLNVGVLGLNSTFRHVSDLAHEGSLTISARQIQQATGGDLPRWSRKYDLCIALTHQPLSWLSNQDEARDAIFNDAANVQVHLCGHLHLEQYAASAMATPGTYYTHQGQSVFGLESFGPNLENRQHGYSLLTFDRAATGLAMRVWPRSAHKKGDGTWRVDRKADFGLRRSSDSSEPMPLALRTAAPVMPVEPLTQASDMTTQRLGAVTESTAAASDLLTHVASGDLVAVVGDRLVRGAGEQALAFADFRAGLWEALNVGGPDDGSLSTEQLLTMVAARDAERARHTVAHFLGNPSVEAIESARHLLEAPWSTFIYLSALADVEAAWKELDPDGDRYLSIDASRTGFRLPPSDRPCLLRLASTAQKKGRTKLTLEPSLDGGGTPTGDWNRYARQLLARAPVVFMADSVTSLPIWKFIADRDTARKSYQPPAFLVCPDLPPHLEAAVVLYGVQWIRSTVDDFTAEYLNVQRAQVSQGLQRQAHRRRRPHAATLSVELKRRGAGLGSRDYLLGNNPTWGDVLGGFAAELSTKKAVIKELDSTDSSSVVLLTGTAGSGRTTALMQTALALQTGSQRVAWVDSTTDRTIPSIIEEVYNEAYDVVVVDDVDVFGAEASRLVRELRGGGDTPRRVIAGVRSVRDYVLEDLSGRKIIHNKDLSSEDVRALVSVLREQKAVANKQLSDADVEELIAGSGRNQLLVGMIQATSGLPFGQKIASECAQLSHTERLMYGCFAVVTSEREGMSEAEALEAAGGDAREAWRSINRLLQAKLIRQQPGGRRFEVRHRVVAEEVRGYLSRNGLLPLVMRGTLRAFAASARDLRGNSHPERRTLTRLLNHSYLIRLKLEQGDIRAIYDEVEDLLHDDFHYWLQRGAFEVEQGDDTFALHDLLSALTTPGGEDDPKVLTEYSYLRLKLARRMRSPEVTQLALDALADLQKVILSNGLKSPHTFVVLAREGVAWLEDASIVDSERQQIVTDAIRLLNLGHRLDATNSEVAANRVPAIARLEILAAARP